MTRLTATRSIVLCTIASFVVILMLRDPAPAFVYDAAQYWGGANAVVSGDHVYELGGLGTRGVLTSLVYVPAAFVVSSLGLSTAAGSWAVLVQNALAISVFGGLLIPLTLRRFMTVTPRHVALASALTVLLLSGFAPYPLMDFPAMTALFVGLILVADRRWWLVVAGGIALAVAVNLRPAYVVPVLLVGCLILFHRRVVALFAAVGSLAPFLVQAWYGWRATGLVSPWPPGTATVTAIQLNYASYGIRYDTIPYTSADPRQWYCNPAMAEHAVDALPSTTGDLLNFFVVNLPESALFAIEKVTATLQWSWATPYSGPGRESLQPLGILACLAATLGILALVIAQKSGATDRFLPRAVVLSTLGSAIVIVGAAPESRFAAPLVAGGIVGICAASLLRGKRVPRKALLTASVLAVLTLVAGSQAMNNSPSRGDITAETCRELASSAVGAVSVAPGDRRMDHSTTDPIRPRAHALPRNQGVRLLGPSGT